MLSFSDANNQLCLWVNLIKLSLLALLTPAGYSISDQKMYNLIWNIISASFGLQETTWLKYQKYDLTPSPPSPPHSPLSSSYNLKRFIFNQRKLKCTEIQSRRIMLEQLKYDMPLNSLALLITSFWILYFCHENFLDLSMLIFIFLIHIY